jgi:acyl-coenzyme A synthetase/AMP-(fatty) acid ligase
MNESHDPIVRQSADLSDEFDAALRADADFPVIFGSSGTDTRASISSIAERFGSEPVVSKCRAGQVIGMAVKNGPEFLAAVLAIWRRSGVALLIDAGTPAARCREIAAGFGAIGVIRTREADSPIFESIHPTVGTVHEGAAIIKLTSGTTGAPRGILLSSPAVRADSEAIEAVMGIRAGDRIGACIPMSFSYGFGSLVVPALLFQRQLVEPDPGRPLGIMTAARRFEASILPTVPVFLSALLKRDADWQLPPSIRLVVSAGAPLPSEVARRFRARFGQPIHVFYGASECGGITYDRFGDAAERGTVGTPVPGVQVSLDSVSGVLEVRSPAVASCYVPPDPALSKGVFRTSDLASWEGAELRLLGRQGSLINVGGHKVNPREVESVISRLPGVDAVFVIPIETEQRYTVCCAVIESLEVTRHQVHTWCQEHLQSFKCPKRITIVSELPRTARGKFAAKAIRELALAGANSGRS